MTQKEESATTIHHHLTLVSRITLGIAIAAFVSVIAFGGWYLFTQAQKDKAVEPGTVTATQAEPSAEEMATEYRTALVSILNGSTFSDSADAETRLNKVLELTVPADLKQVHLDVVIALTEAKVGKYDEAKARMNTLRAEHAWLAI
jgi:hypothetical protein